ncbi:MAG: hypothetical protein EOO11_11200 [Chitinophagaceae bacterium]|nr:MAG: hypothetical protein EOO11_11200 [Chitinophagaceae bacterium]
MRTFKQLSAFALLVVLIVISCRRNLSEDVAAPPLDDAAFTEATVKKWYVGSYKRTEAWRAAWAADKKFPVWTDAYVYKRPGQEMIEFPLRRQKTRLLVRNASALTPVQARQVVSATVSRVLFIRQRNKEVAVRQVDYVPEWNYLERKGFDISSVRYGEAGNDFSGTMIVRDWSGNPLRMYQLRNGKVTRHVSTKRVPSGDKTGAGRTAERTCEMVEYCMWYEDCVVRGDVITDECGEPYTDYSDCYVQEECSGEDEDPCVTYGINCDDGGGGGGEDEVDYSCANGQKSNFDSEAGGASTASVDDAGSSTAVDPLTRNVARSWTCLNGFGGWTLLSHETGVIKNVPFQGSTRWEWESIAHNSITKNGSTLPGVSVSYSQGVGTPHTSSLYASMALTFSVTYSFVCDCPAIPTSWIITPVDKNYSATSPFWYAQP